MAKQALRRPRTLRGAVDIPGDKSVSHRALMFNALASGSATIAGLSFGQDVVSTMGCMSSLGVEFESSEGQVTVHGSGGLLQESTDISGRRQQRHFHAVAFRDFSQASPSSPS